MKFHLNSPTFNQSKTNLLFFILLIFSTLITVNSSSWISAWMGMEINLMSFIPMMMMKNKMFKPSISMMTYFLIQSSSSCFLLFFIMMNKIELFTNKINFLNYFIQLSLLMKLGAAPFHWWTPKIINLLNWKNCFILLTWQKLNPLILIFLTKFSNLIYYSILFSLIIGSILGLNQSSLKLIIAYSSINHISWLMISMMLNFSTFILYYVVYFLTILTICLMLNSLNINYLTQMYKNNTNLTLKILLTFMFFSMGGIPPMLGFFPKFKILMLMLNNNLIMESLMFILFSLITLSYYMNPMMSGLILFKINSKWTINSFYLVNKFILIILINLFLAMLLILPLSLL
uniref:NADH-ubiquinone oxidoreductase chain 2 n=1 Tax=Agenocimbex maculatus TaxID=2507170 RepID=A0A977TJ81_9HYME|nr:NADH dehydrogenase subunit 2 [Agenocimbex maculatus]